MSECPIEAAPRAEAIDNFEHLLSLVEKPQVGNAALEARANSSRPSARVQAGLSKVVNQLERFRAEAYWNQVMREMAVRGATNPRRDPA